MTTTTQPSLTPRPMRADARRNYERIVTAARAAFAEHGPDASLDDIARRAGVGPGTLYRHFPTRLALQEAVIRGHLEALRAQADELQLTHAPGDALVSWLRIKLAHSVTDRGLGAVAEIALLARESELSATCTALHEAAKALLTRAQESGAVRRDIDGACLMKLVNGIALATEGEPDAAAQADRLLTLAIGGLRVQDPVVPPRPAHRERGAGG